MRNGFHAMLLVALLALAGCAISGNFAGSISTAGLDWHSETDLGIALTDPTVGPDPEP